MKTICIIAMTIFVSVHFLSAILDVNNKHYVPNILFALVEMFAFIGYFRIF